MKILNDDKREVVVKKDNYLTELKNTQEMCALLMKTAHYSKMGQEGIFAIVETAKSLGIDPRQALGGGLYFVRGKVEMSARMMNALIRSKKHSVTRDKRSNDEICILHGKRADNSDSWSESFSVAEAKRAGIYKENGPWGTYTRDMLFARALSRLARQLFPDIIGNTFVEGEISLDPNIKDDSCPESEKEKVTVVADKITEEEVNQLVSLFEKVPDYGKEIAGFLERKEIGGIAEMPKEMYVKVVERAKSKIEELEMEAV